MKDTTQLQTFKRDVFISALFRVITIVIGFLTGVLAARLLGPAGRGELAIIQSWGAFIATISMMGLPDAIVYYTARESKKSKEYWISGITLSLLFGLFFATVGWFTMPWLLKAQSMEVIFTARWYTLILIFIFAFQWISLSVLRGLKVLTLWNILQIFLPSFGWLMVLVVAWLFHQSNPLFLAYSFLVMMGIVTILTLFITYRYLSGYLSIKFRLWKLLIYYGLPLALAILLQQMMLNGRLVQLFMGATQPPQEIGIFTVAVAWGMISRPLNLAISSVIFPYVSSSPANQIKFFTQGVLISFVLMVLMSGILSLLAPIAIPLLFGKKFISAIPVAIIMSWVGGIAALRETFEEGLRGLGRPKTVLVAEAVGVLIVSCLLIKVVTIWKALGGAIALLIGYGVVLIILLIDVKRATKLSFKQILIPNSLK